MDIETYNRREKMLKLREELLAVEENRMAGRTGCALDELDAYLDETIAAMLEAERIAKDPSVKGYNDLDELFADLKK